jgi:hypothetical protein
VIVALKIIAVSNLCPPPFRRQVAFKWFVDSFVFNWSPHALCSIPSLFVRSGFYTAKTLETYRLHLANMNVNKKLDRFKQWAGERMGGEVKTNVSDDFKALEIEMGLRNDGVPALNLAGLLIVTKTRHGETA